MKFAVRGGSKPLMSFADNPRGENELLLARLRWLLGEQEVRPQDVLVLTFSRQRATQLAEVVAGAKLPGVKEVHLTIRDRDRPLGQKGCLTVSTVASAKGYDAYCVLLASANDFPTDVKGRANFYVGCTRAIEYLEVFAFETRGLAREMRDVLARTGDLKHC